MKLSKCMMYGALVVDNAVGAPRYPNKSPMRKLMKIKKFVFEWLANSFGAESKRFENWSTKFENNFNRFEERYLDCGITEEEHVAKVMGQQVTELRKRRSDGTRKGKGRGKGRNGNRMPKEARIPRQFRRYNKDDVQKGITDITEGFSLWAQRYVSDCPKQPERQVLRATHWRDMLLEKLRKKQERDARKAAKLADQQ